MNKLIFCQLAKQSLLFAQCRASAFRISQAQIDLWTLYHRAQAAGLTH